MVLERAIETQRLRLLRIIAGLLVAVGFLSVGPVSRSFSDWVCEYVDSILSRAELAGRYLIVAQARLMAARAGIDLDRNRFSECLIFDFTACEADFSLSECRARLKALQAVLFDLPGQARCLLRRIGKQKRSEERAARPLPRPAMRRSVSLRAWRLARTRIERPPDRTAVRSRIYISPFSHLPPANGREAQVQAGV